MADTKVSALSNASALGGTEKWHGVQSSADVAISATQMKTFAVGAGSVAVSSGKTLTASVTMTLQGGDSSVLSIAASKTLTVSNTLTFTGTDSSSVAFGAGGTVLYTIAPMVLEDANTVAQRNSTTAQAKYVYNTFTNASNYERFGIVWSSNDCQLGISAAGTGNTTRQLHISSGGTARFNVGGSQILSIGTSATQLVTGNFHFHGATSSFPMLKRSSATLETKLADDSAYAQATMLQLAIVDGVTAPSATAGLAKIFVDTADGDLKIIFGDGTTKVLSADT